MFNSNQMSLEDTYTYQLQDHWSKCCFCGALNGKFNRPLEEHRPRCRFIGPANMDNMSRPNYIKFIIEDDSHLVPAMHSNAKLTAELASLKKKLQSCKCVVEKQNNEQ